MESNFNEVVGVIHRIRSQSGRPQGDGVYIDFRKIRNLSPTAALILAAELDRWNQIKTRGRLQTVDAEQWDSTVRVLLRDMGFFGLLRVEGSPGGVGGNDDEMRYVQFRTGRIADGEAIARLQEENLEPVFGEMPRKEQLYAAVTEAMTNVVQHAYQARRRYPHWWLAGSMNAHTSEVSVVIYDRGDGIPRTLPRRIAEWIKSIRKDADGLMIRAAHELMRSSTKQAHRGHGLSRDIRGYLNVLDCQASYRVVSRKGEYIYRRFREGDERHELKSHAEPLNGTLIEWMLTLK